MITKTTQTDSIASMTSLALMKAKSLLVIREGRVNKVYKDSLGHLTVGIGHLVRPTDNLKLGDVISDEMVDTFFEEDVRVALRAALTQMQDLKIISPDFLAALISVNFQLGSRWHWKTENGGKGFYKTYDLIKNRKIDQAIRNLRASRWYKQTPKRVEDFITSLNNIFQNYEGVKNA